MTYWIWWRTARVVPETGGYLVTPWVFDGKTFPTEADAWNEALQWTRWEESWSESLRWELWDDRPCAAEAVVLPAGQRPDQGWVDAPGQVIDPANWWRETGGEGG